MRNLPPSPALSILANSPGTFAGRRLGVVLSGGADADVLEALQAAAQAVGAQCQLIAASVGALVDEDGSSLPGVQQLAGSPSVVYDAVAILGDGEALSEMPAARDFIADAYAHCKFIGYAPDASPLLEQVLGDQPGDRGLIALTSAADVAGFLETLNELRYWERETPSDTTGWEWPAVAPDAGAAAKASDSRNGKKRANGKAQTTGAQPAAKR